MRHLILPDKQVRKGVPTDHIRWAVQAILEYKPDRVIDLADHWDLPAFSRYDPCGSMPTRSQNIEEDFEAGNVAFKELDDGIRGHKCDKHILWGNHEYRAERAVYMEPKYAGLIGPQKFYTGKFKRHEFLERVWLDGIVYSHFFQMMNSHYAIGGSIDNRLNKIGDSFVQGHEQGLKIGNRVYPTGRTRHGLVAGSFYLHDEAYKGRQGNDHWRGIVILNEVRDGDYCVMPLSVDYLCRKYEGMSVARFLKKKYKHAEQIYSLARAA